METSSSIIVDSFTYRRLLNETSWLTKKRLFKDRSSFTATFVKIYCVSWFEAFESRIKILLISIGLTVIE